ncbi:MAG: UrcA family protein [Sphingomonadales bacterium]|nr:UrcA family protein [Sphingomonadales bacterium]MDE2568843.1 UrcA family protein [Sphingomonadales bacterium]
MIHRFIPTSLALAAFVVAASASAQPSTQANTPPPGMPVIDAQPPAPRTSGNAPDETIVVEAPRQVKTPESAEPFARQGFMATTVRIPVLYSDLDLARDSDGVRLMNRIERVAADACRELDRVYPLDPDPECISRAEISGRKAAQAVIDAARATKP